MSYDESRNDDAVLALLFFTSHSDGSPAVPSAPTALRRYGAVQLPNVEQTKPWPIN